MVHKQFWSEKSEGKRLLGSVGGTGRILQEKAIIYFFLDCYRVNGNIGVLSRIFNIIFFYLFFQ
jgi:hypothetical protein